MNADKNFEYLLNISFRQQGLRDMVKAQDVINNQYDTDDNKMYNYTKENISGYINQFDLYNKSLLTVDSSLDQVMNAIYKCSKDITIINSNRFLKYYFYLKKAALLSLKYNQYIDFISAPYDPTIFMKNQKFRDSLHICHPDSGCFWEMIYNIFPLEQIKNGLFYNPELDKEIIKSNNLYLKNEDTYIETGKKIKLVRPSFICENVLDLSGKLNRSFDNIFLSDIYNNYCSQYVNFLSFKSSLEKLKKHLSDDGKILITYFQDVDTNKLSKLPYKKIIANNKLLLIPPNNCSCKQHNEDGVLIYQKNIKNR